MSIQAAIQTNIATKEGRYLHSFVIVGESGDANVPDGVCIRFYGCNISTLTMGKNCVISIDGGTCASVVGSTSDLIARGMTFSGDLKLDNTKSDFFNCIFNGQTLLTNKSYIRTDNSTYSGGTFAIKASSGSQGRATRCTFSGHGTAAVKAEGGGYVMLANCSSVKGTTAALWSDDRGIIEAIDCPSLIGTGTSALKVSNYGRIQAMNCDTIQGALQAIVGETHGQVVLNKCQTILGLGDSGATLDSNAGLECRLFTSFKGMGNSAVIANNMNYVYFLQGQTLESAAQDAIELHNGSHAHVTGVINVKGAGRHGINMDLTSEVTINDVLLVKGGGGHGILAATKCNIQAHEITTIQGVSGHGVKLSDGCTFASFQVKTITGDAGDGVNATNSSVSIQGSDDLIGKAGHGANLNASNFICARSTNINGMAGHGVLATNGSVTTLSRLTLVNGAAGDGVSMTDSTLAAANCTTFNGAAGHGINASGSVVRVKKVQIIQGAAGDGCNLVNPDFKAEGCSIQGSVNGVTAVGRGAGQDQVVIDNCPSILGGSVGYDFTGVKAVTRGGAVGGATALKLTNTHLDTTKDSFDGNAEGTTSILNIKESTITGTVEWTDMAIGDQLGNHGTNITMSGVGFVMAGTTLPAGTSTSSGLVGANADLGATVLAGGGVALAAGTADIQGAGAALMANAGIPELTVNYVSASDVAVDINAPAQVLVTTPDFRVNGA